MLEQFEIKQTRIKDLEAMIEKIDEFKVSRFLLREIEWAIAAEVQSLVLFLPGSRGPKTRIGETTRAKQLFLLQQGQFQKPKRTEFRPLPNHHKKSAPEPNA